MLLLSYAIINLIGYYILKGAIIIFLKLKYPKFIFNKLIIILGIFIFSLVYINSIYSIFSTNIDFMNRIFHISTVYKLLLVIFLISTFFLFIFLSKVFTLNLLTRKNFLILLIIISFALRILFIIFVKTEPISDFEKLYKCAVQIVNTGNFNSVHSSYFSWFPYQIGFVLFQTLIISIFGSNIFVLKLINILLSIGICILVYLIATKVFDEKVGRIAGILYCVYIESIYMCSLLTNQILSAFLFYLAIYIVLSEHKKYKLILAGILIGIGNIIRPEGIIVILSIAIFLLFLKKNHFPNFISPIGKIRVLSRFNKIIPIASIIITYFLVTNVYDFVTLNTGISKTSLSKGDTYWKLNVGLNYTSKGLYNRADDSHIQKYPIGEKRIAEEKKMIVEKLTHNKNFLDFFITKFKKQWCDFDYTVSTYVSTKNTILTPKKVLVTIYIEKVFYATIVFFIIVSLILLYKNTPERNNHLLLLVQVLVSVLVFLFIEIQYRYRFYIIPSFFILSCYGISKAIQKISQWNLFNVTSRKV